MSLTQERETMLATLHGRALDARAPRPILGDAMAVEAVETIDYDFGRMQVTPGVAATIVMRAKFLDGWVREFLTAHPGPVTVVHLGAGLDTRPWRIAPGPEVEWFDVDYPEVIDIRRQVLPERSHYQMIGSSVTDPAWLARVPAGRPTLMIAEGLTMYLREDDGIALLQRLAARFGPGTTMGFDAFNSLNIRLQKLNRPVKLSGSTLYWAIDEPRALAERVPGLRLRDEVDVLFSPTARELPPALRFFAALTWPFPRARHMSRFLRYEVGEA